MGFKWSAVQIRPPRLRLLKMTDLGAMWSLVAISKKPETTLFPRFFPCSLLCNNSGSRI
jgi:hypothetical protein